MGNALEYAEKTLSGFKVKAGLKKNESLICLGTVLTSSSLTPIFITLGDGVLLAKIIPSVLAVISAILTSWMQLRKPQKLWGLYREAQRLIEDQITKYNFKVGEFKSHENIDSLLAERIAEIALNAHNEWTKVIPTPESLNQKEARTDGKKI